MHRVAIVLDPEFGDKILKLSTRLHVWAIDSKENKLAAKEVWDGEFVSLFTVTIFDRHIAYTPEEECLFVLDNVAGHHDYDFGGKWLVAEVYGVGLTNEVKKGFLEYGFTDFSIGEGGFLAEREVKVLEE